MSTELQSHAVALTQALVRLDTTTGTKGEPAGLTFIADLFQELPGYQICLPLDADGQPNALIVLPTNPRQHDLLLFSGHVDTVTAIADDWQTSPWSGDIVDGIMHGRGTSDMKSGIGAQIAAMLAAGPEAPVALAISIREEWGCAGSPEVLAALNLAGVFVPTWQPAGPLEGQPTIGAMLVAEPTDGRLILGHKGPLWINVTTRGRAAHGSTPEKGQSAITAMAQLIVRAQEKLPRRTHWRLGTETLNIGQIQGGTMRNVVPDRCTISVDMRTVDPDGEPLLNWWRSQPEVADVTIESTHGAVWTEPTNPWVAALPLTPDPDPVGYGTEASTIGEGLHWPPTVIWGPGEMATMHIVGEQVPVVAIEEAAVGYLASIAAWEQVAASVTGN